MKKLSCIISAIVLALVASLSFTSCLTTSGTSVSKTTKISMYDNCPQITSALLAEVALKASDSSYKGVTSFSFTGTPSSANIKPVATYYGYCTAIKEAITKGTGKTCSLSFNTLATGKGTTIDLSNTDAILKSLLTMALYNYTTVYAIYKY
jgi:hypothetical protein